jgi:hypothetical protein
MSAGIWFWLIFVLCLLGAFAGPWLVPGWPVWGSALVVFILLGLLGWKVFGPPIQ